MSSGSQLWMVGVDYQTSPLEERSLVALQEPSDFAAITAGANEFYFLSTCNRSEIYFVSDELSPQEVTHRWIERIRHHHGESAEINPAAFQWAQRSEAIRHLFRTVASLESMVLGETQIASQAKRAYELQAAAGSIGPLLHRSLQKSFQVAKRVRSQTEVGKLAVSISSVAVKLAEQILGDLSRYRVGVVGLGEIGRLTAEHFSSAEPKQLVLFNRTVATAEAMAENFKKEGLDAVVAPSATALVESCDLVISATENLWLDRAAVEAMDSRGWPRFLLDLSVPPSMARLKQPLKIYQFSIDDLQKIASENAQLRQSEMQKAERLVDEEVRAFWKSLDTLNLSETFGRLALKWNDLTRAELDSLHSRLGHLSSQDRDEIEKSMRRLQSKFLHDPMTGLRLQLQQTQETESFLQFFRNLFKV